MKDFFFNTIQEFNDYIGVKTLHPLVSIARVENISPIQEAVHHYGLYALFLKENKGCKLSYGRTEYDFDEMTVTSFAPGQSVKVEPNPRVPLAKYTVLAFHPELLNRTQLGKNISRYEFFDYTSNEALHLSAAEVNIFRDVLSMISLELEHPIDRHSRELIVSNIELLLNYCLRFYDRQFITREEINHSVVKKFISLLDEYIARRRSVRACPPWPTLPTNAAIRLNISGNWLRLRLAKPLRALSTSVCFRLLASYLWMKPSALRKSASASALNIRSTLSAFSRRRRARLQANIAKRRRYNNACIEKLLLRLSDRSEI